MTKDGSLLNDCIAAISDSENANLFKESDNAVNTEYPLDEGVVKILESLQQKDTGNDEFFLFKCLDEIKALWNLLIEKSIICLRFFDLREPFLENSNKHPSAYGIKGMKDYYKQYTEFEDVLYGGAKYYRDHLVHVIRVWLLGVQYLLEQKCTYLDSIEIASGFEYNRLEKLSIWTLISLTHDLGYPLEKAQKIIERTRQMMKCFISEPNISMDLSFNGVQNNMNDFVLRFMSSKMIPRNNRCSKHNECEMIKGDNDTVYVSRLQPKYYFKFQKSLENYKHGTISALIIYKLLLFFLESDFTINEDYEFNKEDARQFYIRREVLRSIASHTCSDIYHLKLCSFAVLLLITDDCQEWGRKGISELYSKGKVDYKLNSLKFSVNNPSDKLVTVSEKYYTPESTSDKIEKDQLIRILKNLYNQFCTYTSLFRDGQDTKNRDFTYKKDCEIQFTDKTDIKYQVEFSVANKTGSYFKIVFSSSRLDRVEPDYGFDFLKKDVYDDFIKPDPDKIQANEITFDFILPKPDDRIE